MLVEIEKAALFLRLVDVAGLPDVTHQLEDEVFGPYQFEGGTTFLRYRSSDDAWDVLVDVVVPDEHDAEISWEEEEANIRACLEQGPRPALPADLSRKVQAEPFVFVGSRYAWTFFPELRRWELASLSHY